MEANSGSLAPLGVASALVADDHELFRDALATLLKRELCFREVIQVGTLHAAITQLGHAPETSLVTIDLSMPEMGAAASMAGIRKVHPDVRLVVISDSERREDILQALDSGAHGFIPKTYTIAEMLAAFRTILEGRIFVPRSLAETSINALSAARAAKPPQPGSSPVLSPRQRSVMDLLALGWSNKEIARDLQMAEGTVKIHVNAIYRTLGARNRVSAVSAMAALGNRYWPAVASEPNGNHEFRVGSEGTVER